MVTVESAITAHSTMTQARGRKAALRLLRERVAMYHVKGGTMKVKVRSVSAEVASMNGGDVFIVDEGASTLYVWEGKDANKAERLMGISEADRMNSELHKDAFKVVRVEQGKEPNEFWDCLGGKATVPPASAAGSNSSH